MRRKRVHTRADLNMSQPLFSFQGPKQADIGHFVSTPLTVRYTLQARTWTLQNGRLWCEQADKQLKELDAWEVRSRFLQAQSPTRMLQFLQETGDFDGSRSGHWYARELFQIQNTAREMLPRRPPKWDADLFSNPRILAAFRRYRTFAVEFSWRRRMPAAAIVTSTTLEAILATIHIDHLTKAKFGFCARSDCRRAFQIVSKHQRMYCSQSCAHLETVRRSRAREKQGSTA